MDFVVMTHIGQVILVVVATNPRQPIIAQGFRGRHRAAGQPQGVDVIGIEVPAGIEQLAGFVAIGTDTGVDLATLGQAYGAQVGFSADIELDACRFEDLSQHVPAQPMAVGGGIVLPIFAGQVNDRRRRHDLLRLREGAKHGKHHYHQPV